MTQPLPIFVVDSFTAKPFAGNPAAVCVLPQPADAIWMQDVAIEMNLSETAFLVGRDDGGYDLRWFTPGAEVDLCGHATLASARVLWEQGLLASDQEAVFHTRSGRLTARPDGDWIELDFPRNDPVACELPNGLAAALGAEPVFCGHSRFDLLVQVADETQLRALDPDFRRLAALDTRGVIVTSRSADPTFDFCSRFFAPAVGIDEDPVTGSAHCCLAPFWQQHLGKDRMVAHQVSRRSGVVRVHVVGDRVLLGGQAVTVWRGELTAAAGDSSAAR